MKFPIPKGALDSDIAILGRKGGGKTVTAKGIVERLLDDKRRVLILDPLGGWRGLRTSADGRKPGYPVAIIGGEHADYPLDLALAVPLADVLARENVPTIIDLSDVTKSQQQKFLIHFLRELRRANRDAMTLVLEEADVFAPQNPLGDDSKELHSEIDWISRRGRSRGFRLISICQRPARLAKDVLTQASVLVSHVLPSPQDRDAVRAWVEGNGDRDEAKQVFDTLAKLDVGEAWIWSTVQDVAFLKRARFPMIGTLDTTATPKAGQKRVEQKTLADVDVSAIKSALEAAKNPRSVAHVAGASPATTKAIAAAISAVDTKAIERRHAAELKAAGAAVAGEVAAMLEEKAKKFKALALQVADVAEGLIGEARDLNRRAREGRLVQIDKAAGPAESALSAAVNGKTKSFRAPAVYDSRSSGMPGGAAKMFNILDTNPPRVLTWQQVATLAGLRMHGGHWNSGKKYLLDAGLVQGVQGGVAIVNVRADAPAPVTDPAELVRIWAPTLPGAGQRMLEYIFEQGGEVARDTMALDLGMKPHGGHWNSGLASLRKNGLAEVGETIKLSELLHP